MSAVYPTPSAGFFRDSVFLPYYRNELRRRVNPDTGLLFTEDEIAVITAPHGEQWIKANALDSALMVLVARGDWLVDQLIPSTASREMLEELWAKLLDVPALVASGGSGPVLAPNTPPFTVFTGSTIIGDTAASLAKTTTGLRYQVLFTVNAGVNGGDVPLQMISIDTGEITNIETGTKLQWISNVPDAVMAIEAEVTEDFRDGTDEETVPQWANRIERRLRHKQGAANAAHIQAWIEDESNAIARAFVYAAAPAPGALIITFLSKRGKTVGPDALIPSLGLMATVTAAIVPPASPLLPSRSRVWPVPINAIRADTIVELSMTTGTSVGWDDIFPWPGQVGGVAPYISAVASQTAITLHAETSPPPAVPKLMVWNVATSRFERLQTLSVTPSGVNLYAVVLAAAPSITLAVGQYVSPYTQLADQIAETAEGYFDTLGPGEVIGPSDPMIERSFRTPQPKEEWPFRGGAGITTYLADQLGSLVADQRFVSMSPYTSPPLPVDPITGPGKLTLGQFAISPF